MDEYEESTTRIRIAWVTAQTADFAVGPGDYHYEHADFSEIDRLLAERDRVVAANAWDEGYGHGWVDLQDRQEKPAPTPNPYRITEENN